MEDPKDLMIPAQDLVMRTSLTNFYHWGNRHQFHKVHQQNPGWTAVMMTLINPTQPYQSQLGKSSECFWGSWITGWIKLKPSSGNCRQKDKLDFNLELVPTLAPPPKSPAISSGSVYSEDNDGSFVPFLSSVKVTTGEGGAPIPRSDSLESPQTPLFEEDQSQPLEDFPRITFSGDGWEMQMRHPNKKKITGQRFWKKVYVRLSTPNDVPTVQIYNSSKDKDPIQEIPLQPCYSVSDIGEIFLISQFCFSKSAY